MSDPVSVDEAVFDLFKIKSVKAKALPPLKTGVIGCDLTIAYPAD